MSSNSVHPRAVGRPKKNSHSSDQTREQLLDIASHLFAYHGIAATSFAAIAREANVTPALLHYYFNDKPQLAEAVLTRAVTPLLTHIQASSNLSECLRECHGYLLSKPWLPQLIMREVMMNGGQLRALFSSRFGPQLFALGQQLFSREKEQHHLRVNCDEVRHAIFAVAMLIHPFIVAPIGAELFGRQIDAVELNHCLEDAISLFFHGASPDEEVLNE